MQMKARRPHGAGTLPAPVDRLKASARYNNGVLEITLPMTKEARINSLSSRDAVLIRSTIFALVMVAIHLLR